MSLYDVLNVPKNSKKSDIEKAYKKMAKKVHPLINKKGDKEFMELNRAYSILKDDYKRDFYDLAGDACINLLDNEKDSYVIVRMFDRVNILCCALFLIGFIFNTLFLPVSLYYSISQYVLLIYLILGGFLLLPLIRNLLRLKFAFVRQTSYVILRYLLFTRLINTSNKWIFLFIAFLEAFLIFINLGSYSSKTLFVSYVPFLINLSCATICKFNKYEFFSALLTYFLLHIYFFIPQNPLSKTLSSIVLFLYFSPIFLIELGVRNLLIFLPLSLLWLVAINGIFFGLIKLRTFIPSYTPKKKELEYYV
ncbi:DnaJ domain-containing protein [Vairimorpha necatrix]|uniref:DnaJ domain-containing protein n=1 Tax=Vairimorpha necatrix TaxID=6039 RepID=A0AAX4JCN2_9MICR